MPLDETNIEIIIRLISAHHGRYTEIAEIGARLLNPTVWRAKDGTLSVGQLTQQDKDNLTAKLKELLDEAQVIANDIRQEIAPKP